MKRAALIFAALLASVLTAHATVTTQTFTVTYTCTGSVGPYAFNFPISAATAITVTQNSVVLSSSAYIVVPVNNNFDNGGSVTLNTACPSGQPLVLTRVTPVTQATVFTDNMPVPMKTFENSLDKLTEIAQELAAAKGGSGSGGTVVSVGVGTANGFQGTVTNPNTNPIININVDSTHVLPINTGNGSQFLNNAGTYSTPPGSGTVNPGTQYKLAYYPNSGSQTTVGPDSGCTTDGSGNLSCNSGTFGGSGPPISIPANKATSPASGTAQLGTDASGDLVKSDNAASQVRVTGTTAAGTANDCAKLASNGIDITDAGAPCGSGGGSPGGSNGEIQYNNSGSFGGSATTITAAGSPSIPANVTPASTATRLTLGTDASAAHLEINPNAAGTAYVVSIVSAGTSTHCTEFGTDGISIMDSGATCAGISSYIKYVSQISGIHQNGNLTAATGTSDSTLISAVCATATPTNPVIIYQDGDSALGGNQIQCPSGGNWAILGNGGGVSKTFITSCGISSGVATFGTATNTLVTGQYIQLPGTLTTCTALENQVVQVLSTGLSTTQFEANVSAGNVSSGSESATGVTFEGTGFVSLANTTASIISNGIVPGVAPYTTAGNCESIGFVQPSLGTNVQISGLVLNGNGANQTYYCHGIQLANLTRVNVSNNFVANIYKYGIELNDVNDFVIDSDSIYASSAGTSAINTDGFHIEGLSTNGRISKFYCHTGDDCIALNANEGAGGPISNITINSGVLDNAYRFLRLDSDSGSCSGSSCPTVTNVVASNITGTVYCNDVYMGVSYPVSGAPNPEIDNISLSHGSIINSSSACPTLGQIVQNNHVGNFTLDDWTFDSPNGSGAGTGIWENFTSGSGGGELHTLHTSNIKVKLTPAGNSAAGFFSSNSSGPGVDDWQIDGISVISQGGSYTMACVVCSVGGNWYSNKVQGISTIDSTNVTSVVDTSHLANVTSYDGAASVPQYGNSWCIMGQGSLPNCSGSLTGSWGFEFTPSVSGSTGYYFNTTGNGNQPLLIGQGSTPGGSTGGAFIRLNANSFGDGSQNQVALGNGNSGIALTIDGNQTGHTAGNVGIGYGYAAVVPSLLSVAGNTYTQTLSINTTAPASGFKAEYSGAATDGFLFQASSGNDAPNLYFHGTGRYLSMDTNVDAYRFISETTPGVGGYLMLTCDGSQSSASGCTVYGYLGAGLLYSAAGTPLPSCAVGLKGAQAVVSDATSPTYMGAYTSGGAVTAAVICSYNGSTYAWLTH